MERFYIKTKKFIKDKVLFIYKDFSYLNIRIVLYMNIKYAYLYKLNLIYIKMETANNCEIIYYLIKYGAFLNRIISFNYPNLRPSSCGLKKLLYTRVESRCRTTLETAVYVLTGNVFPSSFNLQLLPRKSESTDKAINYLDISNFIVFSIPSDGRFDGHIFAVIRDNDRYYMIQSYIFAYEIHLNVGSKNSIKELLNNYFKIFNGKDTVWSESNVTLWKLITGVDTSHIIGIKRPSFINVYYLNYPFQLKQPRCTQFTHNLLETTSKRLLSRISNNDLMQVFSDILQGNESIDYLNQYVLTLIDIAINDLKNLNNRDIKIRAINENGSLGEYINFVNIKSPYGDFDLPTSQQYTIETIDSLDVNILNIFADKLKLKTGPNKYPIIMILNNSGLLTGPYIDLLSNPEFAPLIAADTNSLIILSKIKNLPVENQSRLSIINSILTQI